MRGARATWAWLGLAGIIAAALFIWSHEPPRPLAVEWAGCAAEIRGPICEIAPDTRLTIWVPPIECEEIEIEIGGRRIDAKGEPIQRGVRYRLTPSLNDETLSVSACGASWSLALRRREMPAILDEVDRIRRQSPEEALRKLSSAIDLPPHFLGVAAGLEARILAATKGVEKAEPAFARAIALSEANGRISDACSVRRALSFFRSESLQLEAARTVLEQASLCLEHSPSSRALWPYYATLPALEEPNLRRALPLIEQGILGQERLDGSALQLARRLRGRVLTLLGRFDEAAAALRIELGIADTCWKAQFGNELAWTALQAYEAGQPVATLPEIEALLERSASDAGACIDAATLLPVVMLNLAYARVQAGRVEEAAIALEQCRRIWTGETARAEPWFLELEGQIARLRHQTDDALRWFGALDALGGRRVDEHARWRAAIGKGQTFEQLGRQDDAISAYRDAEESTDRQLRLIPFGEGRASFAEARSPGTMRFVSLLMRQGKIDEASAVARQSLRRGLHNLVRASQLSSLDVTARVRWESLVSEYRRKRRELDSVSTERWQLTESELSEIQDQARGLERELRQILDRSVDVESDARDPRPPDEGELLLIYHPLADGWAGFALEHDSAGGKRLGAIDPTTSADDLSLRLLAPFAAAIRRANVVLVLAPGALSSIDFHALPFDGEPLSASKPVLYSLDLGEPLASVSAPRTALITRDRSGTLIEATAEVESIAASLKGATLWQGDQVGELLHALEATDHLHHAGHGISAGADGLESALVLSDHLRLSSGDVLTLKHVPRTVVLAGCDLGRSAPMTTTLTLGVGQAFVVRGAERVVAPVRPVKDRDAARFSSLLYEALQRESAFSAAVRSAQLRLRQVDPTADWSAFRQLVP